MRVRILLDDSIWKKMENFGKKWKLLNINGKRYAELEAPWTRDSLAALLKLSNKSK